LGEQLEDAGLHLGRNANAVVADGDHHLASLAARDQIDAAAGGRIFGGVDQKIADTLGQAYLVSLNDERLCGCRDAERMLLRVDHGAALIDGCFEEFIDLGRLALQRELSAGDARNVGQIVD